MGLDPICGKHSHGFVLLHGQKEATRYRSGSGIRKRLELTVGKRLLMAHGRFERIFLQISQGHLGKPSSPPWEQNTSWCWAKEKLPSETKMYLRNEGENSRSWKLLELMPCTNIEKRRKLFELL